MIGACYKLGILRLAEVAAKYKDTHRQPAPCPTGIHSAHLQKVRDGEYVPSGIIADLVLDVVVNGDRRSGLAEAASRRCSSRSHRTGFHFSYPGSSADGILLYEVR